MTNVTRKQHTFTDRTKPTKRPLQFVLIGLVVIAAAGGLMYHFLHSQTVIAPSAEPYRYTIKQTAEPQVQYRKNSFFNTVPDPVNTAYLTSITDAIKAHFNLAFTANEATDLTYYYSANARLQALYGSNKDDDAGQSSVWTKQYTLLAPVKQSQNSSRITIDPVIQIPFASYYQQAEQFRNAFSAPTTSELTVNYTVTIQGTVHGTPFTETKTSSLIVPLDQQVFKIATKFDRTTNKQIVSASTKHLEKTLRTIELPAAVILILLGFGALTYGLRKQKVKTPHQRELEKIYRYHKGVIIQAKRPPDLDHKNIVVIKDFDDMLNLEEELKTPIIASNVTDYTTHFFIANDNIVYVHTVGIMIPFKNVAPNSAA